MLFLHRTLLNAALLLSVAGFATGTLAAGSEAASGFSADYDKCMDANTTTSGMVECVTAETRRQDQRLNANYQQGMKTLTAQQRTALRDVQRQWIQFRDADCALEVGLTGGTMDRINAQTCLLQATKVRADALAVRFLPQDR